MGKGGLWSFPHHPGSCGARCFYCREGAPTVSEKNQGGVNVATEKPFPPPVPRDVLHACAHMPGWPTNATTRHMAERLIYIEEQHRRLRELAEKVLKDGGCGCCASSEWSENRHELRTFLEQSSSGSKG